ncbi:MAG: alpha/beta fold hydrolase [Acidobacteria bacterium]|nr:alpha/beta fold hydrolase [Acidobacteriota bacterium]
MLPVAALVALGIAAFSFWVVHTVAHPPTHAYLVTPEGYKLLSPRGVKATEETWANDDGTRSRGWLLRGAEGAPAVVLLHAYGADRSWLLNLAVKINEATNFTVLCPDLRGHGQSPTVSTTTFGAREGADAAAALDFLRALKTPQQRPLVGKRMGLYGVELGAYAALRSAARAGDAASINALALDSVPARPDDLLRGLMRDRVGFGSGALFQIARAGSRLYFLGKYEDAPACEAAASLDGRKVLLLSGTDAGSLRDSTRELARCFPGAGAVELKADLPVTGLQASSATGEAGEAYDRLIIDFFQQSLR